MEKKRIEESSINQELLEQILKEVKELREKVDKFYSTKEVNQDKQYNPGINKVKTYNKDIGNLKQLLNIVGYNTKAYTFLDSIVNNQYPTLTFKQYAAASSIASKFGFEKPIAQ